MKLLREMAMILILSAVTAFIYNYFSPKGLSLIRKEVVKESIPDSILFSSSASVSQSVPTEVDSQLIQPHDSIPAQKKKEPEVRARKQEPVSKEEAAPIGIKVITLEQFARLVQEKRTLILDAREPDEYSKGRVPGAINIPYLSVDQYFETIALYPRDTLVAIYCNNLMCPLGRGLAEFMEQLEFKHLLLFEGGWDLWEREEMPIEH